MRTRTSPANDLLDDDLRPSGPRARALPRVHFTRDWTGVLRAVPRAIATLGSEARVLSTAARVLVPVVCDGVVVHRLEDGALHREHVHHASRDGASVLAASARIREGALRVARSETSELVDDGTLIVSVPASAPRALALVSSTAFGDRDLAHAEVLAQWLALVLSLGAAEPPLVDEAVAAAVHDLMNPLSVIRVNATAARNKRSGADLEAHLALIERCAQRMQHIAVDMLDDVRRATERISLELSWMPVSELLDEANAAVRDAADARAISLAVQRCDGVVLCDRFRILQLLVNLLDNAIKYTPREGHVSLTAERLDGCVRVSVCDDGRGIAPEDVPKLFDRYWRSSPGTGIGLATARALAAAHETELKVTTAPGLGSTFWFDLHSA